MSDFVPFVGNLWNPLNWPAWFRNKNGNIALSVNRVGHQGPVYDNTAQPLLFFNDNPQYHIVVNRKAAMFSNMEIYLKDAKTGERVDNDYSKKLYKLLYNPNPLQRFNKWVKEFKQHESVYGCTYLYKNKVNNLMAGLPVTLWNIPPEYMRPILTGKMFDQVLVEDIIQHFEYRDAKGTRNYTPAEIMYTVLTDLINPASSQSPTVHLNRPLSNIRHAYDYRNVIMSEKGAIGILSNKSKDGAGAVPLNKGEKEKLEQAYQRDFGTGHGQRRIHISEGSLSWDPMSYPTKDLMLFEEIDQDLATIIMSLGLNLNMFLQSTYENVKHGVIQAYQDTIQPEADQFCQDLAIFLGVPEGLELCASFEHIPALKAARLEHMKAIQTIVDSFNKAVQSGFMSQETAINMLETDFGIPAADLTTSKVINNLNRMSPLVATNALSAMTVNELRVLIGLPTIPQGEVLVNANPTPSSTPAQD